MKIGYPKDWYFIKNVDWLKSTNQRILIEPELEPFLKEGATYIIGKDFETYRDSYSPAIQRAIPVWRNGKIINKLPKNKP
jgi:hypothetical protein